MNSIARQVARTVSIREASTNKEIFVDLAKFKMLSELTGVPAAKIAEQEGRARAAQILSKAAVLPGTLDGSPLGGDHDVAARAFVESLRGLSVFDTLLANGMRRVPSRSRVVSASVAISGSTPGEQQIKPISQMSLTPNDLPLHKALGAIAVSAELLKFAGAEALALLDSELKNAAVAAVDNSFLANLYAGVTPTASAGATTANVLTDLGVLLSALTLSASSRVFLIVSPANAAKLMTKVSSGSGAAFPLLSLNGGEILRGISVIVSDQVPTGAVIAIDATGIAGSSELPTMAVIRHGDIAFSDTPDSPAGAATVFQNLWQANNVALVVERFFSFAKIRDGSVAALSGAAY